MNFGGRKKCQAKPFASVVTVCSKHLWKYNRHSHNPKPQRDGSDQRSAFSHYGVIPQGELDGDETFHADQREVKDDDRNDK